MREYMLILCDVFYILLALYGVYFAAVSVGFMGKEKVVAEADRQMRFAVLVPARNEAHCISGIVESIKKQDYPRELVDIYVIPNSCTDNTAAAAVAAGAQVLRVSPAVGSKGQALHEAFAQLLQGGVHDAYCVFDADNEANPRFLAEMNNALSSGARAAKSRILAKNAHESWVCGCYEIFFCSANVFLNAARRKLGLSARLIGTGFAVRRELLEELGGWNATTLTEDAEFYAMLTARGERIAFVPGAIAYDEEPLSFRESLVQRRRWVSGIMGVGRAKAALLLRAAAGGRGGGSAFDALAQLSFTCVQALVIPAFLLQVCAHPLTALSGLSTAAVSFYVGSVLTGGAALLLEGRLTKHTGKALLFYPAFVFSFLPLQTLSLFCPNKAWKPIRHTGVRLHRIESPSG